jgi:DNA-binding MurR/RpiR family transcriptional regulator
MTVRERLLTLQAAFSPAESRIAERLLDGYPVAGLGSLTRLAEESGVSGPSVLRLLAKLGFAGYPAFRDHLRAEVAGLLAGSAREQADSTDVLQQAVATLGQQLEATFRLQDSGVFEQAVRNLADLDATVQVTGGSFSGVAADYLARNLSVVRAGVSEVQTDARSRTVAALDSGPSTVVVAFDYRPLDPALIEFGQQVLQRGARLIFVTDSALSPLAAAPSLVLRVSSAGLPPFPSMLGGFFIGETLVSAVAERVGDRVHERLRDFTDRADNSFGLWRQS